ncbi:beta-1 adrenergic receptor-like [Glandiceps talaboti]
MNVSEAIHTTSEEGNSTDQRCDYDFTAAYVVVLLITSTIVLAIIVGNVLVIMSVHRFPVLQTVNNYFICSLAYADLLVVLAAVLNAGLTLDVIPRRGSIYFCLLQSTVFETGTLASIIHLLVIAIDRHLAISTPLTYHTTMTPRRAKGTIFITWLIPVIYLLLHYLSVAVNSDISFYDVVCNSVDTLPSLFAIFYGGPFIIMAFLYLHVFWIARKHSKRIAQQGKLFENATYKNDLKAVKTLSIVIGAFVVCWLPPIILFSSTSVDWPICGTPWLFFLSISLSVSNSALNPAIYAWVSKEFRGAFKKLLGRNEKMKTHRRISCRTPVVDVEL